MKHYIYKRRSFPSSTTTAIDAYATNYLSAHRPMLLLLQKVHKELAVISKDDPVGSNQSN